MAAWRIIVWLFCMDMLLFDCSFFSDCKDTVFILRVQ